MRARHNRGGVVTLLAFALFSQLDGAVSQAVSLVDRSSCAFGSPNALIYAFSGAGWITPIPGGNIDRRYGTNTNINVRQWIQDWQSATSVHGGTQATGEALGEITVTFEDLGADLGRADCGSGIMKFDTDYLLSGTNENAEDLRGVVRHETGHLLGLNHTGVGATQEGGYSAMNTCLNQAQRRAVLIRADDRAGWGYSNDYGAEGNNNVLTNPGFEYAGGYAWAPFNGMSVSETTSGARHGYRRVSVYAPSTSSTYQTATLIADDSVPSVQFGLFGSKINGSTTGSVTIEAQFVPVNYASTGSSCSFSSGLNENTVNSSGPLQIMGASSSAVATSPSWTELRVPWSGSITLPQRTGILVLVIRHALRTGGQPDWLRIDDARITVTAT